MNKKLMILAAAVLTFAACTTKNEEKPLFDEKDDFSFE